MKRFIFSLFFLVSSLSFATAIRCSWVNSLQADPFIVVTDKADILETTQAAFIQETDVADRYPVTLGDYEITKVDAKVNLTFGKAGKIDWNKIDKKECFVRYGAFHAVQNLRRNTTDTKGDYLAEYSSYPRMEIRPGEEDTCHTTEAKPQKPEPMYCFKINL